jgi:hypothetical protein
MCCWVMDRFRKYDTPAPVVWLHWVKWVTSSTYTRYRSEAMQRGGEARSTVLQRGDVLCGASNVTSNSLTSDPRLNMEIRIAPNALVLNAAPPDASSQFT